MTMGGLPIHIYIGRERGEREREREPRANKRIRSSRGRDARDRFWLPPNFAEAPNFEDEPKQA